MVSDLLMSILFADDTNLFFNGPNLNDLENEKKSTKDWSLYKYMGKGE